MFDDWKWIISYTRKYSKEVCFYTVLSIISVSAGVVSSVASKYVIDIITNYRTEKLAIMLALMIGGLVSNLLLTMVLNRVSVKLSVNLNNTIKADVFDKILDADWMKLNQYSSGDIVNRFNSDIQKVSSGAFSWLPTAVVSGYQFLVTFFVILYYDKVMALIALGSAPILLFSSRYLLKRQREYQKEVRKTSSDVMAFEVETFYNYDTIKSFGITSEYGKRIRKWLERSKKIHLEYNWFSIKTNLFLTVLGNLVQYIAFGYCLYLLWSKGITFGTMILFLQQRGQLSKSFQQVVHLVPTFLETSVSARRIRELFDLPKEMHLQAPSHVEHVSKGFAIQMSDVAFSYEGDKAISYSSFLARPGEMVAVVGPSGAGKTTLIRLILGLVRPEQGTVNLIASDGEQIEANADARRWISYVPQGNTVFSGTIAENLRMGKSKATDEELEEALKLACAWDFVKDMPKQLYAEVGEKGKGLSEGQAQRIAIARAILRDAPILLLDESTSALDVGTEKQVLSHILQHKSNKTCVIITHRQSVVDMCQRVYRVDDTRMIEWSKMR